jgi:hypothetical protein
MSLVDEIAEAFALSNSEPPHRALPKSRNSMIIFSERAARDATASLAGCGKSRNFWKTVMKRARNGNPDLIKSMSYEGAKGDELGWKHHRPTFSAAC